MHAIHMQTDSSMSKAEKPPHVVCMAYPAQSHIKAMLKLALLLHTKGIFITFVNTDYNHQRLLKSGALNNFLNNVVDPGFRFATIPDGLPLTEDGVEATQDMASLCRAIQTNLSSPFQQLIENINNNTTTHDDEEFGVIIPPVTCIISDGFMTFSIDVAQNFGIPVVLFWTIAACGFMGFYQYHILIQKGLIPLKDESYLTNGYLDTIVDWIPGMKDIRLRDLPSFVRNTDPNDFVFHFVTLCSQRASLATGQILLTFDTLELELVHALTNMFPNLYTIAPQQILLNNISLQKQYLKDIKYSLWEEQPMCLKWLDSKEPNSVLYVNFGSIVVMSHVQLMEFGWGLANSNHCFLWVIRPDMVVGESQNFVREFMETTTTNEMGCITSWCPQEDVLNHASIGGFVTHGGWNSIIESLSAGVPMLCWPFFGDQVINSRYVCAEWECGMEIGSDAKREFVEKLVRELMDGVEDRRMRNKALEWKRLGEDACCPSGSSSMNLDKFANLLKK